MKSIIVTTSVIILGAVGVLSFLLGWIGAGMAENVGAMWLLFGIGVVALSALLRFLLAVLTHGSPS